MAKEFQLVKKIESITIHYDISDKGFVDNLEKYIKKLTTDAKGRSRISLEEPNEYDSIHVFIYASVAHFKKIFGQIIASRHEHKFLTQKLSDEDLYIVQDNDGNIHIASPKGKNVDKITAILTVKILSEYLDEKQSIEIKKNITSILRTERLKKEKEERTKKEKEAEEAEKEKQEEEEKAKEEAEAEEEKEDSEDDVDIDEFIDTEQEIEEIVSDEEKQIPIWMVWGWQSYVKGKLKKRDDIKKFAEYMGRKGIIKLRKIDKIYEEEFAVAGVSYIIDTYGLKMFKKIVASPDDMLKFLNTTQYKFDREVKAYTYSKYSIEEEKMEMDKKGAKNITKIEISSDGSFNMIESNEKGKIIQ